MSILCQEKKGFDHLNHRKNVLGGHENRGSPNAQYALRANIMENMFVLRKKEFIRHNIVLFTAQGNGHLLGANDITFGRTVYTTTARCISSKVKVIWMNRSDLLGIKESNITAWNNL